ncbi:MAG: hypothetical protein MZV65_36500 [Chromatiales bacterium]|nr:hypothetical protein [Chromatiales bacterium]
MSRTTSVIAFALDLASGVVTTFAGKGTAGLADVDGATAQFNQPYNVKLDAEVNLYVFVADRNNYRVRSIAPDGKVKTVVGSATVGNVDGSVMTARSSTARSISSSMPLQTGVCVSEEHNHGIRVVVP